MIFSQCLIFLCLPIFGGKHPCLKGFPEDENERCHLFRRPRMYVQKRKYIAKDDFSIEAVNVYEDVMKQGSLDLPWDALAAYTAPWDLHERYVRRHPNEPYPIILESKKEVSSPPLGNIPLRHAFMPKEEKTDFKKYQRQNEKSNNKRKSYYFSRSSLPVILAVLFEVITKVFSTHLPGKVAKTPTILLHSDIGVSCTKFPGR
uniref:Uncharacterized protein n=1 Tax=Rhodnius prolixus TaxID=13249 RepID=A0A4V0Y8R4_RHOPR